MTELLFYQDVNLKQCEARVVDVGADGIVLDRSVFYPLGGGQPGDCGRLHLTAGADVAIVTTQRRRSDGTVLHVPAPGSGEHLKVGEQVLASIDWSRRYAHMRVHTCLHLLSAVIGAGVTGGSVREASGRLDFDLPDTRLDRAEVEEGLNRLITQAHAVTPRWISGAELESRPELVRTMSVAPPRGVDRVRLIEITGVDLQACGGTHVTNTAHIGPVAVTKIENKGARNRRISIALVAGSA